ncbi:MAG: hypothetical protein AB1546_00150 [bacterium]
MSARKRRAVKRPMYNRKGHLARNITILVILLLLLIFLVALVFYIWPLFSQKKMFTSKSGKRYTVGEAFRKQINKTGSIFSR